MLSQTASEPLHLDVQALKTASLVYRAINHDFRQRILQLLHKRERMTVTEIYVKLRREQCVVSSHLGVLREAKLVQGEREGKQIYYSINYEQLRKLHSLSESLLKS